MWNKNICLTSRKSIMIMIILFVSSLVLAGVLYTPEHIVEIEETPPVNNEETEMWVPTEEDIAYQDSMFQIIQNTQDDITEIKEDIVFILERLDYEDGTYDSIRYVKGGTIDKLRN